MIDGCEISRAARTFLTPSKIWRLEEPLRLKRREPTRIRRANPLSLTLRQSNAATSFFAEASAGPYMLHRPLRQTAKQHRYGTSRRLFIDCREWTESASGDGAAIDQVVIAFHAEVVMRAGGDVEIGLVPSTLT
jgi:hypothetical protein